jgi:hypothetical protein
MTRPKRRFYQCTCPGRKRTKALNGWLEAPWHSGRNRRWRDRVGDRHDTAPRRIGIRRCRGAEDIFNAAVARTVPLDFAATKHHIQRMGHSSLSAPFINTTPINPVPGMGPYDFCWCKSGKKYKWCHFRRERQAPINIFEIEARMLDELRGGYCSHPDPVTDACSSTITRAHTVQRKGGLAAIAEEGHVLTVKPTMKEMIETEGNPSPRKIGIGKASVFPGFCSKHDTALFKPVEGRSLTLNAEAAFLFAYRAIAYERFSKEAQLRINKIQAEADRGQPFWKQALMQTHLYAVRGGIEVGMQDINGWKRSFDDRLLSGSRDGFHFLAVKFDHVLPLVACGAFHPEFDFDGRPLQMLGRRGIEYDHITLTVTAFEGHTIVVFGWVGSSDGPAGALADSYVKIPESRKADALIRLLFVQTDNLFIRPSWWEALGSDDQKALKHLTKSGTTERARTGGDLVDDGRQLVVASVLEIVRG